MHRQVGRLFALENAADIDAGTIVRVPDAAAIAHQAAGRGEFGILIDGRNPVAERQCGELFGSAGEETVGADHERVGSHLKQRCKDGSEVAASVQGMELDPKDARRRLQASPCEFAIRIARVEEHGNGGRRGNYLVQQLQPFRRYLYVQLRRARDIAAWPAQAADEAEVHRICRGREDDGYRGDCRLYRVPNRTREHPMSVRAMKAGAIVRRRQGASAPHARVAWPELFR